MSATITSTRPGRDESAQLVCYLTADKAWSLGEATIKRGGDVLRPVYCSFLGTAANAKHLRKEAEAGMPLAVGDAAKGETYAGHRIEFPRSADWRWLETDIGDGCVVVEVMLRELIDSQSPDGERCQFLLAAPQRWSQGSRAAVARLLVSRLDSRVAAPILQDERFWGHLLDSMVTQEWCHVPSGMRMDRGPLYAFPATHTSELFGGHCYLIDATVDELDSWIVASTRAYVRATRKSGVPREPLAPRAQPEPAAASTPRPAPPPPPPPPDVATGRQRRLPFSLRSAT